MTFNVWFDDFALHQRALELFRLISQIQPDIICLQEVTPKFLKILKLASCFRDGAVISDLDGSTLQGYGVVTITNNPNISPEEFTITTFPSMMGRNLLSVRVRINGEALIIGNVHLESLESSRIRRTQLEISHLALTQSYDHSMLMGDFNFDDKRNWDIRSTPLENDSMKQALPGWIDTWEHLRPTEEGKTFDTASNPLLRTHNFERMRYDRIMLKSSSWIPQSIDLVGTEQFMELHGFGVVPSDHYGLVALYKWHQPVQEPAHTLERPTSQESCAVS